MLCPLSFHSLVQIPLFSLVAVTHLSLFLSFTSNFFFSPPFLSLSLSPSRSISPYLFLSLSRALARSLSSLSTCSSFLLVLSHLFHLAHLSRSLTLSCSLSLSRALSHSLSLSRSLSRSLPSRSLSLALSRCRSCLLSLVLSIMTGKVLKARQHIEEEILQTKCPRCRKVFYDFEGCFAVRYEFLILVMITTS